MWAGLRESARAAVAVLLLVACHGASAAAPFDNTINARGQPLLTPSNYKMYGRDVYYEIPVNPIGVLAMMHGCAHDASDFWPRVSCPECDGTLVARWGRSTLR